MSDGGISFIMAMGWANQELSCPIWAKRDWLSELRADRHELERALHESMSRLYWRGKEPKPPEPDFPEDVNAFCRRVAAGEDVFPGWYFDTAKAIDAIQRWNDAVDRAWNIGLGFSDEVVKQAKPSNRKARKKLGYTLRITPKQFGKGYGEDKVAGLRDEMIQFQISPQAYTLDIWREECQKFMDFLTEGKTPSGVFMDKNLPRLTHKQAGNVLWFIQVALGWVNTDEIDVCSDCGALIVTDRETHDWCSKCGKMRCENCTTAPSHCTCE